MYFMYLFVLIVFFLVLYSSLVLLESSYLNIGGLTTLYLLLFYCQFTLLYWEQASLFSCYLVFLKFGIFSLYLITAFTNRQMNFYNTALIFFLLISSALLFAYTDLILFFILVELFSLFLVFFLLFSRTNLEDKKTSILSFLLLNMLYLIAVVFLFQYLVYNYNNTNVNFLYMISGNRGSLLALFITIVLLIKIAGGPLVLWNRFIYQNLTLTDLYWYSFFNMVIVVSHLSLLKFFYLANHFSIIGLLVLLTTLVFVSSRPRKFFDIFLISFYVFIILLICMF